MKQQIFALAFAGAAAARPAGLKKREVPQELSHFNVLQIVQENLQLNNPDEIVDPVFGLLGAAAAAEGAGNIQDTDCLQQAVADQAFTNALEAGDVEGMTFALIYRALERNTGEVGLASALCESIEVVNPEIAALQQHQDPASDGALELNKDIATVLAQQIASIGGDPLLANEASTFEPGEIGDPTAAGNTCNVEGDEEGCINSLGLRVDDLSEDEILAAVEGAGAADVDDAAAVEDEEVAVGGGAAAFGSCADPTINFGLPSDGRQEEAFEPADLDTFNHGSANNINIISSFICSQLTNACDADETAVSTCEQAAAAADGLQAAAAAAAFNSALGF